MKIMIPTLAGPPALELVAQAAKAMAHPARLRILSMLRRGPLCVCQMTAVLGIAPSTASGHLLALKRGGLVRETKRGKWVEYSLRDEGGYRALLDAALAPLEADQQTRADASAARRVRRVPLDVLCSGGVNLQTGARSKDAASARGRQDRTP